MAEYIKFVMVGHHSRVEYAQRITAMLDAHLLVDNGHHGPTGIIGALEWASCQPCRVVVLEDDALPVPGLTRLVVDWLNCFPDDMLSFYLGTGRPPQ
ncbi:hypothetical protein ACG99R_004790 [Klebsiella aerogenes]